MCTNGCGRSNLASNYVEHIDLPIAFVLITSTLKGFWSVIETSHSEEVLISNQYSEGFT